jgi:DNA-directed RNA polymerase subunit RPC12/RpoP
MIKFSCKLCGEKLSVQDQYSGKGFECPKCNIAGVVPDKSPKIRFHCKSCGQRIRVPQIHAGKKGKCPKCKDLVVVPYRKAGPADGSGTVTIVCPMCNETIHAPEDSRGEFIECPRCSSYVEGLSGDMPAESGPSIQSSTDEDPYEEESDVPEG